MKKVLSIFGLMIFQVIVLCGAVPEQLMSKFVSIGASRGEIEAMGQGSTGLSDADWTILANLNLSSEALTEFVDKVQEKNNPKAALQFIENKYAKQATRQDEKEKKGVGEAMSVQEAARRDAALKRAEQELKASQEAAITRAEAERLERERVQRRRLEQEERIRKDAENKAAEEQERQRKEAEKKVLVEWVCPVCTFAGNNAASTTCVVCSAVVWACPTCASKNKTTSTKCTACGAVKPKAEEKKVLWWNCSRCTFRNEVARTKCAMCNAARVEEKGEKQESEADRQKALVPTLPLVNVGSTCFANATLQCLFQLPALQKLVLGPACSAVLQKGHSPEVTFIAEYQRLVTALQGQKTTAAYNPQVFCTAMQTRVFDGKKGMQDASEFFHGFAMDLRGLCVKTPFDVEVVSTTSCGSCHGETKNSEMQTYLALPIVGSTLKSCLAGYQVSEKLSDYVCRYQDCYKVNSTRTLKVSNLPAVFVFQLKRFAGSEATSKLETPISLPLELKQADFYQGDEKGEGVVYDLVGMVNHNGKSLKGGHYTSYVKNSGDGAWRFCDDAKVVTCTLEQVRLVADAGIDKGYHDSTPYLLFYLRRSDVKVSKVS